MVLKTYSIGPSTARIVWSSEDKSGVSGIGNGIQSEGVMVSTKQVIHDETLPVSIDSRWQIFQDTHNECSEEGKHVSSPCCIKSDPSSSLLIARNCHLQGMIDPMTIVPPLSNLSTERTLPHILVGVLTKLDYGLIYINHIIPTDICKNAKWLPHDLRKKARHSYLVAPFGWIFRYTPASNNIVVIGCGKQVDNDDNNGDGDGDDDDDDNDDDDDDDDANYYDELDFEAKKVTNTLTTLHATRVLALDMKKGYYKGCYELLYVVYDHDVDTTTPSEQDDQQFWE
eukprot:jgi/Psemu1/24786/gm1.24786_g